jgi:hypothetical protein
VIHQFSKTSRPDPNRQFLPLSISVPFLTTGSQLNALVVCLCAVLSTVADESESEYSPLVAPGSVNSLAMETDQTTDSLFEIRDPETVFRAQSPGPVGLPPVGGDPFLQAPGIVDPYSGLPGGGFLYGANGPQPFRMGSQPRLDMFYTPEEMTSLGSRFEAWGFDLSIENTQPSSLFQGTMFSVTPQFGMRMYSGPQDVDMPESVFRFGLDMEWETQQAGPMSMLIGFSPSINSDLKGSSLNRTAFNWDSKAVLMYQLSPTWQAIMGVGFWDRLNDKIIPYAGWIYTDDVFEMKLTFPEAQLSMFVGNELGTAKWMYLRGEYHVESYQIERVGTQDQVELSDYRVVLGTKMDTGRLNWYLEGGFIFDRDVRFRSVTSDFDVSTGIITQFGVRF